MKNNLFTTLKEVLKKDDRFLSQDGYLLKNQIREKTNSLDEKLIESLLENDILREKFFIKIKDIFVFDAKKFFQFIDNKEFLPDSYTSFKNKIGLTDKKGDYLANSGEIVLSWPYKDCILAGGQTKEDTKRNEIFYNEILGSDDIDRLLDEKVFTNFKRIDKSGEHKLDTFKRDKEINKARGLPEDTITDNLLIKGNNLLALHSLKSNFAGKVKLIYIDPPYNTGNDSFKYNDRFNHSTWLTFMKNRLEVAKELLKDDGVIFVQCDDNEQAYLKVLMDEIFGRENFIGNIIWRKRAGGGNDSKHLATEHENILFFGKSINVKSFGIKREKISHYKKDENGFFLIKPLNDKSLQDSPGLHYDIKLPNGLVLKGNTHQWKMTEKKFLDKLNNNAIIFTNKNNINYKHYIDIEKNINPASIFYNLALNTEGTKEMKLLFGSKVFSNPKPEKLIAKLIEIGTKTGDIVLDYHLGSGTTCAVAHKMGRQYIGIEQMDYIETISKERLKKVIEGEQGGISKNVEWKGGGEFVYMEIMEENERFIKEIECAKNDDELLEIYETIKNSEFINYYVDIKSIDENISDFKDLSLENKKKFLIELLDKNLLYKNYSEINDKNSGVSEEDKKMNNLYYNN